MILAIDQGTTGHDLPRLRRRRRAAPAAPTASSPSTSRGRAGSSTTPPRSGTSRARSRARRSTTPAAAPASCAAVGITNQRETVCVWDPQTGEPLHRALVWQDRRTAARCDELRAAGHEALVRARTGLVLDPYFSGTKIEWLLEQRRRPARARPRRPRRVRHDRHAGWSSSSPASTSPTPPTRRARCSTTSTRASGTRSSASCSACPRGRCPRSGRRSASSARPSPRRCTATRVPVAGIAGDQQAALYGQACLDPGLGKNTYGTGSFVLLNAGDEPPPAPPGLLTTVAWGIGQRTVYALEAAIFVTGAAVQWLRDGLGIIERGSGDRGAGRVAGRQRRRLLRPGADRPRLAALGPVRARHDRRAHARQRRARTSRARRSRRSPTRPSTRSGRWRPRGETPLTELRADGGATVNGWLMQFQADVLGVPVVVPEVSETTALGAAMLAGVGRGGLDRRTRSCAAGGSARASSRAMGDDEREHAAAGAGAKPSRAARGWSGRAVRSRSLMTEEKLAR